MSKGTVSEIMPIYAKQAHRGKKEEQWSQVENNPDWYDRHTLHMCLSNTANWHCNDKR